MSHFGEHLGSTYKVNEVYSHMKTKQKKKKLAEEFPVDVHHDSGDWK